MLRLKNEPIINVYSKQYPVGQGGLHLSIIECIKHDNDNFITKQAYIYDCGDSTSADENSPITREIDNLLDDIYYHLITPCCLYRNILLDKLYIFISHLHQDHCNGLLHLKNSIQLKQITKTKPYLILPYMKETEKEILIGAYEEDRGLSKSDYEKFVHSPEEFFENIFDVIYITDDDEFIEKNVPNCNNCNNEINTAFDNMNRKIINHNQEIHIGNSEYYWVLRAFCNPICPDELNCIRNNINKNFDDISIEVNKKNKSIYQKVIKSHNLSSICLYSGPCYYKPGEAFLHTGDIKLLKENVYSKFKEHYNKYLENVCIAQIPHHGSKMDSCLKTFNIFPNLKLLYVTKQENPNGRQYPHLSLEYIDKNFVQEVTEAPKTVLSFENIYALDHTFYTDKTIHEKANIHGDFENLNGILKFEYISKRTHTDELLNFKDKYITCSPKRPRMLTSDKLLFLVMIDDSNKDIPKIIGRARTYGFNPNNIVSQDMVNKCPKLQHFKYYVQLYNIEVINDEIKNGIPLYDIIKQFNLNMFPKTKAKNPYKAYAQQSYREISKDATKYINYLLDKKQLIKLDI